MNDVLIMSGVEVSKQQLLLFMRLYLNIDQQIDSLDLMFSGFGFNTQKVLVLTYFFINFVNI